MKVERLKLAKLDESLAPEIDLLIVSASFEIRCRSVADAIRPERVRSVIVAQNRNHAEFHNDHAQYLLRRFSSNSTLLELDTGDPIFTADSIARRLRQCAEKKPRNIVIDISTFTREGFLILYSALNVICSGETTKHYVYARAKEYSTGAKLEDKWLSRGTAEVRSVLGYPGAFEPSRKIHLIALVGFEYDRVAELIRRCEPSIISLGQASNAETDAVEHLAVHNFNYERLRSVFGDVARFQFAGYDPDLTRDAILNQFRSREGFNTIIAPMNTKLSTLGAAKAGLAEPSIQIAYAQAILYNVQAYSTPGDVCYVATDD